MFPPPPFFPHSVLNITELILREKKDDSIAIYFAREGVSGVTEFTWKQIKEQVRKIRNALLSTGIGPGDVVATVISNSVYAICICLATLSIGAVWSSSSPDLGPEAIVDRYAQVNPKLIFADNGYVYAGKHIKLESSISKWSHELGKKSPSLRKVVIVPYCKLQMDIGEIYFGTSFNDFLAAGESQQMQYEMVPFSHPAFILYSSGTVRQDRVKNPGCFIRHCGFLTLSTL